jgi:hypothetical protein
MNMVSHSEIGLGFPILIAQFIYALELVLQLALLE